MKKAVILSPQTFEKHARAARLAESAPVRGQTRANFQTPTYQYLRVDTGAANDYGYPAFIQVSEDGGLTWEDQSTTPVRLRTDGDAVLAEDQYYDARFVGFSAPDTGYDGGEACFKVVSGGGHPALDYINCYIPYTGGSIFNVPLDESFYTVDTWEGTSTGAIEFPSTGYWKVSASIIGNLVKSTSPTAGEYQYFTVAFSWGASSASEITAPNESGTIPALFYSGWYAASSGALNPFSPIMTQTRDVIVKVNTANAEAFTVSGYGLTSAWDGQIHQGSSVIGHKIAEL